MLFTLQKVNTDLAELHRLIDSFFAQLDEKVLFSDIDFPEWYDDVFGETDLNNKLEIVFNSYKALPSNNDREKVIKAFQDTNKIQDLCENTNGITAIKPASLHFSIRTPIINLFKHLWKNSLPYHKFNDHFSTNLDDYVDDFNTINDIEVCPFCGLENILNLDGQARTAIDHWLCKDTYPYIHVNFDNLVPMGTGCNSRPSKGTKDVIYKSTGRVKGLYPYCNHGGVLVTFNFINEPTVSNDKISNDDWSLKINIIDPNDKEIFDSWLRLFNIKDKYNSTITNGVFKNWESQYKRYIAKSNLLTHANTIEQLKANLIEFRSTFPVNYRERSIVYVAFFDYLIDRASDRYLQGLCENLGR
nr:hypothetical protein [uncultured Carboxylicivirga sp.]